MPQTVPDGFEFEALTDGEPTRTLNGGSAGTSPILAEQVQDAVTALRSDVDDAADAASRGWRPITSASITGQATFDLDLTAGGVFPADTFVAMRFVVWGSLDANSNFWVRYNNDSAISHRWGRFTFRFDTESADDRGRNNDATEWAVGSWGTAISSLELLITGTQSGVAATYMSQTIRAGGATTHHGAWAGGRLVGTGSDAALTSIRFGRFTPATQYDTANVVVEGFRP